MSSNELAVIDAADVKAALLDGKQLPGVDDPEQVAFQIRGSIIAAQTVEQILAAFDSEGWLELLGVPVQIDGVAWRRSALPDGLPVYAVVRGTRLDTGDACVLTTGGGSVMAALYRLDELDAWPQTLKLEQTKANAEGRQALLLKRVNVAAIAPADHGGALDVDVDDITQTA